MKIVVIVYSNDPETVWNAFRFATTSLIYENRVSVFLLGKGVEAMTISTLKYDIVEQVDLFRNSGGKIIGCGVCCESRKEEMPFLQQELQCDLGSMQELYGLVMEADKVLTF
ncbi:MAG: DsrE family protein [Gammaproteobacteria bacterium]|nr:DsrE family protein [Gammaproteobacteria bacterium]MDH5512120.1 DsrE family protein [Gammaproteobacteria bacterium]